MGSPLFWWWRRGVEEGVLLRVGEVRHCVEVGGDELAARVLVDAELRVLDLVVVDLAVKADDDGAHVGVVRQRVPAGACCVGAGGRTTRACLHREGGSTRT